MTVGWLDCSSGASGDMLLGALHGAGVPLEVLARAVDAVQLPVTLRATEARRAGLAAVKIDVFTDERPGSVTRPWPHVRQLLTDAPLDSVVRDRALATFGRLATAEAAVHGRAVEEVHFHEVGALDAIADIVGAAAGFAYLGLSELVVSPVALGGGSVRTAHGTLPVPAPAVLEIVRTAGIFAYGGPIDVELCTPTGAAILAEQATGYGSLPSMRISAIGAGAGDRDLPDRPNIVRLLVGNSQLDSASDSPSGSATELLLETNIDDLDLRLWPDVLARLLEAGAADAWLTPILMKKGRPAHTLAVLAPVAALDAVRDLVYRETTTLGLRITTVAKEALEREWLTIQVDGEAIRVKVGRRAGRMVNAMPEWADVARAAAATGQPSKQVLAAAMGKAAKLLSD
jgi:pyridinium-3,5-bisthiocarboxylic acid mononucleotide nickel chelatase